MHVFYIHIVETLYNDELLHVSPNSVFKEVMFIIWKWPWGIYHKN